MNSPESKIIPIAIVVEGPLLEGLKQFGEDKIARNRAGFDASVPMLRKPSWIRVRIPPELHRSLALEAAEQGVSLNRLASARLAA